MTHVDPGATTTDGIVNYKINSSIISNEKEIRAGMNADISILAAEKDHVLVIPKASIVTHDGKMFTNVITDKKRKKYEEREISVGLTGDGNLIEAKSGIGEGEDIAIISK